MGAAVQRIRRVARCFIRYWTPRFDGWVTNDGSSVYRDRAHSRQSVREDTPRQAPGLCGTPARQFEDSDDRKTRKADELILMRAGGGADLIRPSGTKLQ